LKLIVSQHVGQKLYVLIAAVHASS